MSLVDELDREMLDKAIKIMDNHPRYGPAEKAITQLVEQFRSNDIHENVLLKATVINTLYSTSILDITRVADHIYNQKIDKVLYNKHIVLPSAVDYIRRGHGILPSVANCPKCTSKKVKIQNLKKFQYMPGQYNAMGTCPNCNGRLLVNELDFLSFASKYCSFHNPAYPIRDNLVVDIVGYLNKRYKWYQHKEFNKKDYQYYSLIMKRVAHQFEFGDDFKSLDKGLWVLAKYKYRNKAGVKSDDYINGEVEKFYQDDI
jgi:hypothetical protein